MGKKVVAICQARMGSVRLPGKVLKQVGGRPLLAYQAERMLASDLTDQLVIATSDDPKDDAIAQFCREQGLHCFRGSLHDVLHRFESAADAYDADVVVRMTADCPLIDPRIIDQVIDAHLASDFDYTSNTLQRTYPRGMDVEVFERAALEQAEQFARHSSEREHVTPYIYGRPRQFKLGSVKSEPNLSRHRWTVDTLEDFQLVSAILEAIPPENPLFSMQDVLELVERHPEWERLNAHVEQKQE